MERWYVELGVAHQREESRGGKRDDEQGLEAELHRKLQVVIDETQHGVVSAKENIVKIYKYHLWLC